MTKMLKISGLALLLSIYFTPASAQTIPEGGETANRAEILKSIPAERLSKIKQAFNLDHDTYVAIVSDTSINQVQRNILLRAFLIKRQRVIDSVMTPAEAIKIRILRASILKNDSINHITLLKKHEEELNKVPHRKLNSPSRNSNH